MRGNGMTKPAYPVRGEMVWNNSGKPGCRQVQVGKVAFEMGQWRIYVNGVPFSRKGFLQYFSPTKREF